MADVVFTPLQEKVFTAFSRNKLSQSFYFTGGTALSVFHYKHRESEDLDFFSETDFDNQPVIDFMSQLGKSLHIPVRFTQKYKTRIFELVKDDVLLLKIDFVHYPHARLETGVKYHHISVDTTKDIGANKILTLNQRTEVKDFVDVFYLLKEYTIWDLLYAYEAKFNMKIDLVLLASDFQKANEFETLPIMKKDLTLTELKKFYQYETLKIGRRIV